MKLKNFILHSKDVSKSTYMWNMIGSLIMAFQSVILLMVLTRTVGLQEAGIFTIAYANANLFLNIGKYGMRYYQVSDVQGEYSFREYRASRYVTVIAMMVASIVYLAVVSSRNSYSFEKSMTILWMCMFKVPDVIEDVYYGEYQRQGRLDVAAKCMAIRIISTILLYMIGIIVLRNQLWALMISTCYTAIVTIIFLKWTYDSFETSDRRERKNVVHILKECFPLFAGAFLSLYIGNAPKYAIDRQLSDELQACYGFIAMPVFVIGLLNGFIFNPMMYQITKLWDKKNVSAFLKKIGKQLLIVAGITIVCIAGAYLLGIPVLSILYNTDLSDYKTELILLLVGGGFLGATGVLNAALTIIRKQKAMLIGYVLIAALALALSDVVVEKYAMMGAAMLYLLLMFGLCVCFAVLFVVGVAKEK